VESVYSDPGGRSPVSGFPVLAVKRGRGSTAGAGGWRPVGDGRQAEGRLKAGPEASSKGAWAGGRVSRRRPAKRPGAGDWGRGRPAMVSR